MADNTLQFQWIVTLQGGLDSLYRDDPNVFVAGDLLWYPVQGRNDIRRAPDAMVALGRPKGHRGSYLQWREGNIPPQVVFEVLSPGNRPAEMKAKFDFYEKYDVEEYYVYDPDNVTLKGWLRQAGTLQPIAKIDGWVSPLLGIRFDMSGDELVVYRPDGRRFESYLEVDFQREQERLEKEQARWEKEQAIEQAQWEKEQLIVKTQQEVDQARQAREAAERQKEQAVEQADQARQAREAAERQAEKLAAKLRALGISPDEV